MDRARTKYSLAEGEWIAGTPYRVVRGLGIGGMGEVYEVDHTKTGTRRAIKVLREAADPRSSPALRLAAEGHALQRLDHPNVVRVFEVSALPDGRPYFAMQLLEGTNLSSLLCTQGPMPPERAMGLVRQALRGLAAVHAHGLIHRDVKPSNLYLCSDGTLKVLDFGVAKLVASCPNAVRTAEGLVLGTARYMSPEQLRGTALDGRSDVYAAALVLYELIAGQHPFQGENTVLARLATDARPLRASRELPEGLAQVVACALSRDRAHRYPSATAFAEALSCCTTQTTRCRSSDPYATTRLKPVVVEFRTQRSAAEPGAGNRPPAGGGSKMSRTTRRAYVAGFALSAAAAVLGVSAAVVASCQQTAWHERSAETQASPSGHCVQGMVER